VPPELLTETGDPGLQLARDDLTGEGKRFDEDPAHEPSGGRTIGGTAGGRQKKRTSHQFEKLFEWHRQRAELGFGGFEAGESRGVDLGQPTRDNVAIKGFFGGS
jgi:hypothetical protein